MTVSTQTSSATYAGNGVTTEFPIPFQFFAPTDIEVAVDGVALSLGNDFYPSGGGGGTGSVELLVPPLTGATVQIRRVMPLTQPFRLTGARFPRWELERAFDRTVLACQQVIRDANGGLAVLADPSEGPFTIEPPIEGQIVVGGPDGVSYVNREVTLIDTVPVTLPLAIEDGGTGSTTAAAARTSLGLGSAAVANTGTASGEVPVLDSGGTLNPDTLPLVSSSAAGALPPFLTANNAVYVAGVGWVPGYVQRRLLGASTLTVPATSISVETLSTEWDNYDTIIVEITGLYMAASNSGVRIQLKLGSTWQTGSVYSSAMGGYETGSGFVGAGAPLTELLTYLPLFRGSDLGPDSIDKSLCAVLSCHNLRKLDAALPVIVTGEASTGYDSGNVFGGWISGRVSGSLGPLRGIRLVSEDATNIAAATVRVLGEASYG